MLKRIIKFMFGAKLPCGCGYRFRGKPGDRVDCPKCGLEYTLMRMVKA